MKIRNLTKSIINSKSLIILLLLILFIPFFLTSCSMPEGFQVPQSPLLRDLERKFGSLAVVGIDGNIYLMDQGGSNIKPITDDAQIPTGEESNLIIYQQPTWSHDSKTLAFIRISQLDDGINPNNYSISTYDLEDENLSQIFTNDTLNPFYMYWAPNNEQIGFLTQSNDGIKLILHKVSVNGDSNQILDVGAPYYWSWSPSSEYMLIHAGAADGNSSSERLSFLNLTNTTVTEVMFDHTPSNFQTPSWSPEGKLLVAIETRDGINKLVLTDQYGFLEQTLIEFNGSIGFGFSPDRKKVAAILGDPESGDIIRGQLHVIDLENPEEIKTTEETNTIAFFWAPDSNQIAYFGYNIFSGEVEIQPVESGGEFEQDQQDGAKPDEDQVIETEGQTEEFQVGMVNLNRLDIEENETVQLSDFFRPTDQFLTFLFFFDQYQLSSTIWSPDSRNLVLSVNPFDRAPEIWIAASSGNLTPRRIASGLFSVWSWE